MVIKGNFCMGVSRVLRTVVFLGMGDWVTKQSDLYSTTDVVKQSQTNQEANAIKSKEYSFIPGSLCPNEACEGIKNESVIGDYE